MDIMKMMKQAKALQENMATMQNELAEATVDGSAGGDMVSVTMNGKGEMTGVKIDPSLANADEIDILEDLIMAAHNDAKVKLEALVQEKTKDAMGGLSMPPGMKMPF